MSAAQQYSSNSFMQFPSSIRVWWQDHESSETHGIVKTEVPENVALANNPLLSIPAQSTRAESTNERRRYLPWN